MPLGRRIQKFDLSQRDETFAFAKVVSAREHILEHKMPRLRTHPKCAQFGFLLLA
jgi:hypothetical protein